MEGLRVTSETQAPRSRRGPQAASSPLPSRGSRLQEGPRQWLGAWGWEQGQSQHSLSPSSQETTQLLLRGAGLEETTPRVLQGLGQFLAPQRGCPPCPPTVAADMEGSRA